MDRSLARQLRIYCFPRRWRPARGHGEGGREKRCDAVAGIYAGLRCGEAFLDWTGIGRVRSDGVSGSKSCFSQTLAAASES